MGLEEWIERAEQAVTAGRKSVFGGLRLSKWVELAPISRRGHALRAGKGRVCLDFLGRLTLHAQEWSKAGEKCMEFHP